MTSASTSTTATPTFAVPTHARCNHTDRYELAHELAHDLLYSRPEPETPVLADHNPHEPWLSYPDKGDLTLLFAHAFMDAEGILKHIRILIDERYSDRTVTEVDSDIASPPADDEGDFHWGEYSNDVLRDLACGLRENRHDLTKLQVYIDDITTLAWTGDC